MFHFKSKFILSILCAALPLLALPAKAANIKVASELPVAQAVEKMKGAIEQAGARIFTTVDYAKGAASVGQELRPTHLIIFGSPKIGASAFQMSQTLGLYLPLRVLAYEDAEGKVWMIYGDPADAAEEHGIARDHPSIKKMQGVLKKITSVGAANQAKP